LNSFFIDELKEDEGFRHTVYLDHKGIPTIGYGTKIDEIVVSQETALKWLLAEVAEKEVRLVRLPFFSTLDDVRKDVIRSMAYQMGARGTEMFRDMWTAIGVGDYNAAGDAMRDSRWWRDPKTQGRAERMAQRMEQGRWYV